MENLSLVDAEDRTQDPIRCSALIVVVEVALRTEYVSGFSLFPLFNQVCPLSSLLPLVSPPTHTLYLLPIPSAVLALFPSSENDLLTIGTTAF